MGQFGSKGGLKRIKHIDRGNSLEEIDISLFFRRVNLESIEKSSPFLNEGFNKSSHSVFSKKSQNDLDTHLTQRDELDLSS